MNAGDQAPSYCPPGHVGWHQWTHCPRRMFLRLAFPHQDVRTFQLPSCSWTHHLTLVWLDATDAKGHKWFTVSLNMIASWIHNQDVEKVSAESSATSHMLHSQSCFMNVSSTRLLLTSTSLLLTLEGHDLLALIRASDKKEFDVYH